MRFDIAIVGAGPAGLSVACVLAGAGLSVGLIERQPRAALADPADDGREIALTHRSAALLRSLGAWDRLPEGAVAPLAEARVLNGSSPLALRFAPPPRAGLPLGWMVANHRIRRALYETANAAGNVTVLDGATVTAVQAGAEEAALQLADGRALAARLVVAADTRFSELRRAQGIGAAMRDFGRTMLVCRMAHERPHEGVATEWFGHGITIAMLPLAGDISSAVVTLPAREIAALMALSEDDFAAEITARYGARLGPMRLAGPRHAYPLVAVYAHRFVGRRLALAGDAAVGMHPVTAHGFNFGLLGAERLARAVKHAVAAGHDPADPAALARYERGHRATTWPLFTATNAIAALYGDERPPARLARQGLIALGAALAPVRRAIASRLVAGAAPTTSPATLSPALPPAGTARAPAT